MPEFVKEVIGGIHLSPKGDSLLPLSSMKIKAVIKGTEDHLIECAIRYNLKVHGYEVTSNEVIAIIEADQEVIYNWFNESTEPPFPEGTLLYWTVHS